VRGSLLFSLVSWQQTPAAKEFHLGPLFGSRRTAEQSRVTVGNGLLAWTKSPGAVRWKFSLFDFSPESG